MTRAKTTTNAPPSISNVVQRHPADSVGGEKCFWEYGTFCFAYMRPTFVEAPRRTCKWRPENNRGRYPTRLRLNECMISKCSKVRLLLWGSCALCFALEASSAADDSAVAASPVPDTVVLLHGLGRGPASLWPLARSLKKEGYRVIAVRYPSQRYALPALAERALGPIFTTQGLPAPAPSAPRKPRIHLVTHSLGGILVRQYLRDHGVPSTLGRVVMLAPPNQGSEIVDRLASCKLYAWINGPAGLALGTAPKDSPAALGPLPAGVEVGIIAGDASWNPFFSALIPGPDDGKVAVARTHVEGERDHIVVPYSHTWLMNRAETRHQVSTFLRDGVFEK